MIIITYIPKNLYYKSNKFLIDYWESQKLFLEIFNIEQTSFIEEENGLIAFDIFRYMKKKTTGQKGFVGMKLVLRLMTGWNGIF